MAAAATRSVAIAGRATRRQARKEEEVCAHAGGGSDAPARRRRRGAVACGWRSHPPEAGKKERPRSVRA
jgi:hypothetical protein